MRKTKHQFRILKLIFNNIDKNFFAFFCLIIFCTFLYQEIGQDKPETDDDLHEVQGLIQDYEFKHIRGFRGTKRINNIWLNNYDCTFKIKADFLSLFDKNDFIRDFKKGDQLTLEIPKYDLKHLEKPGNTFFIYSIKSSMRAYLKDGDTLMKEIESSYTNILYACTSLLAGVISILIKRYHPQIIRKS